MKKKYDILKETYCVYCQRGFGSPRKLQNHIMKKHEGTYAWSSIVTATTAERIDPGMRI